MVLPVMFANEPMEVDTNPPSEMVMMREISFLESYQAVRPDGLS